MARDKDQHRARWQTDPVESRNKDGRTSPGFAFRHGRSGPMSYPVISTPRAAAMLVCAAASLAPALPATAQDLYDRKQINLVVGVEAGPGYDAYARFVARHIARFIPGKPSIIVQNMPGAGTAKAAEYIYTLA